MKKLILLLTFISSFAFAQTTVRMSATATGTDTYSCLFNPNVATFNSSTIYVIPFGSANTSGTITLDPDGGGPGAAVSIKGDDGNDLAVGAIKSGGTYAFKFNGTLLRMIGSSGTGGGHTIEDEGTPLTQRTKLNFVGAGVTVTDDSGDDASVVTIGASLPAQYTIDQATPSTAGGTVTLDCNSQIQRSFVGSASFATPKTYALSNTTNTLFFNHFFEVTDVAAVITVPSDWVMSSIDFDGAIWTPPDKGKYEIGGSFDDVNNLWYVKVSGPFN